ncbi:MAG: oligosaccharide flippase family protein [Erysipelotrichaceae bacterium]|nr:oligosaccharide flippase family protein [Erysipelotrichaceae bacterium]
MTQKKQSLILGALTSSAGIFVTKLLGIFYMVPFTALAGEGNLDFYSYAYGIYQILLSISLAGLPFAIATMVAKYYLKEDYKAIEYVRKLSNWMMIGFGFVAFGIVLLFALPIAAYITPNGISPEDLMKTKNTIVVISLAFFTVPLLSSYRGVFQGLKDMKTYAFSQVLEQFSRIAFLLTFGFIAVAVLKQDGIWAVYGAVGGAFISSAISIVHLLIYKRRRISSLKKLADEQETETADHKLLTKELLNFAIPYLLVTILGNSLNIVNTTFFSNAMDFAGESAETTRLLYSMVMLTTNKLTSIPQFLATGFGVAIVPYITTCYEKGDIVMLKKYILDAIDSVLYLAFPLCFFLWGISSEIYYVMYGASSSYQLGGQVLQWSMLIGFFGTISPVINSLMMAVRLRKSNILIMGIGFIVKMLTFYPLIYFFGYSGSITSSVLCSIVIIFMDLVMINRQYHINFRPTLFKIIYMFIGMAAMYGSFFVLRWIGLLVVDQPRLIATVELAVYGAVGILVYLLVTSFLHLPQTIFHLKDDNIFNYLKRKLLKNQRSIDE